MASLLRHRICVFLPIAVCHCYEKGEKTFPYQEGMVRDGRYRRPLYTKPHKSILHMFLIFITVSVINVPFQVVGEVYCLAVAANNNTTLQYVALGSQFVVDLTLILSIILGVVFFSKYYDAVFIDEAK